MSCIQQYTPYIGRAAKMHVHVQYMRRLLLCSYRLVTMFNNIHTVSPSTCWAGLKVDRKRSGQNQFSQVLKTSSHRFWKPVLTGSENKRRIIINAVKFVFIIVNESMIRNIITIETFFSKCTVDHNSHFRTWTAFKR